MHKLKVVLLGAQLLFGALDAHQTRERIGHGGRELNPLMRPFAHSPGLYVEMSGESVAGWWLARKLERKHPRLAWLVQGQDLAGHVSGWAVSRSK